MFPALYDNSHHNQTIYIGNLTGDALGFKFGAVANNDIYSYHYSVTAEYHMIGIPGPPDINSQLYIVATADVDVLIGVVNEIDEADYTQSY